MNKKIVGILVVSLFIVTALQTAGTMNIIITPNDPAYNKQWHLDNTGQTGGTPDADIDAPEAWEIKTGDSNVIIAVIDSGIDYNHPDIESNLWINEDEIPDNGIDDDENGYIDDYHGYNFFHNSSDIRDNYGHGTLVSGIVGAVTNNNIGVAGVAWNCRIMTVKIMDQNYIPSVELVLEGIHYAVDNGAKIISMSLARYEEDFTADEIQQMRETADYVFNIGCISVAAAGNKGIDTPAYPAAFENVIAVAGTDHNDERMEYSTTFASNYGEWVDVAAPGKYIYTTAPTYPNAYGENDYTQRIGTSYATPIVSGVAALLLSRNPALSPDEVINTIKTNVDPYDSEYDLGTGRINAYKALIGCNKPPEKPAPPSGEINCKLGVDYIYYASTTDPEGDDIFYLFDWGNGGTSFIMGPYESGEECNASAIWFEKDEYEVKVQAIDEFGAESEWSDPLIVTMPKTKSINTPFIVFLQNHPHLFPLLRQILGL